MEILIKRYIYIILHGKTLTPTPALTQQNEQGGRSDDITTL